MLDGQARPPLPCRAHRPGSKATTAIGADIVQLLAHATSAERAFIAADHRVGGIGWQIAVTIFAIGAQLQGHEGNLPVGSCAIMPPESLAR